MVIALSNFFIAITEKLYIQQIQKGDAPPPSSKRFFSWNLPQHKKKIPTHWNWDDKYSTVQYSTVQYSAVLYSTVQYSTVLYSAVQYIPPPQLSGYN